MAVPKLLTIMAAGGMRKLGQRRRRPHADALAYRMAVLNSSGAAKASERSSGRGGPRRTHPGLGSGRGIASTSTTYTFLTSSICIIRACISWNVNALLDADRRRRT
eukprot:6179372-Pleurochrysis_carterae.AAC.1